MRQMHEQCQAQVAQVQRDMALVQQQCRQQVATLQEEVSLMHRHHDALGQRQQPAGLVDNKMQQRQELEQLLQQQQQQLDQLRVDGQKIQVRHQQQMEQMQDAAQRFGAEQQQMQAETRVMQSNEASVASALRDRQVGAVAQVLLLCTDCQTQVVAKLLYIDCLTQVVAKYCSND
jgi:hypothetical protein